MEGAVHAGHHHDHGHGHSHGHQSKRSFNVGDEVKVVKGDSHIYGATAKVTDPDWMGKGLIKVSWSADGRICT